jgi:hypothetical protein
MARFGRRYLTPAAWEACLPPDVNGANHNVGLAGAACDKRQERLEQLALPLRIAAYEPQGHAAACQPENVRQREDEDEGVEAHKSLDQRS